MQSVRHLGNRIGLGRERSVDGKGLGVLMMNNHIRLTNRNWSKTNDCYRMNFWWDKVSYIRCCSLNLNYSQSCNPNYNHKHSRRGS